MNNRFSFAILTILFFIWGFITVLNDILIPYLKGVFELTHLEAMLVQTAFFMAYFAGSVIYYIISSTSGDPINRIGYKNGIILGLVIAALGLCMFYPAAQVASYPLFLSALFVLGLGFTVLQIAANPYVAILGDASTASSRLNLAQGFNSLGTTIAPVIGGLLIFKIFKTDMNGGADAVKIPYLVFGLTVLALAAVIKFIHLPSFENHDKVERGLGALKFPQLSLGMIAIFMYVGGEVAIGSMLTGFAGLPEIMNLPKENATVFVSLYWGGLMIGRFTGSASLSNLSNTTKILLSFLIPAVVFPFLIFIFYLNHYSYNEVLPYIPFLFVMAIGFIAARFKAAQTLIVFSLINVLLLVAALLTTGKVAFFLVVATGLFNSIMWSNTFTLAIDKLGKYTSQGSSLLVMMILGGALVPPLQGFLADNPTIGVHGSFIVPVVCFAYLAFYGWKVKGILNE